MAEKKRLIDEKGKLFGKVNIIDLIVLALVLVVVVVLGVKLLNRQSQIPGAGGTGTELEFTVIVYRLSPAVYAEVEKEIALGGDHAGLMASGAMVPGCYVKSVSPQPHKETSRMESGQLELVEEPGYVDATFTIRGVTSNPVTQSVASQEVRVGRSYIVKTKTFEIVNGLVLTCGPVEG